MPRFFLRRRREDRDGKLIALLQSRRQFDTADGLHLSIFLPSRAGEIPSGDTFDRNDARLLHEHRSALKLPPMLAQLRRIIRDPRADQVILKLLEPGEPEQRNRREDLPLARDSIGHDAVKRADPIGRDDQQRITQIIDIANLSAANGEGEIGLK